MISQYCFPRDSPEWGDLAKGPTDQLKRRVIIVTMLKHRRGDKHTSHDYIYSEYDQYRKRLTSICSGDTGGGEAGEYLGTHNDFVEETVLEKGIKNV